MRRMGGALGLVSPSAVAVGAAAVAAGIAEGATYGTGVLFVCSAAGSAAWYAIPRGLAASLAIRGMR